MIRVVKNEEFLSTAGDLSKAARTSRMKNEKRTTFAHKKDPSLSAASIRQPCGCVLLGQDISRVCSTATVQRRLV
jgi:hypothetical protein